MAQRVLPLIMMVMLGATAARAETPLDAVAHFIADAGNSIARATEPQPPRPLHQTLARAPLPNLRPGDSDVPTPAVTISAPPPAPVAAASPTPAVATTAAAAVQTPAIVRAPVAAANQPPAAPPTLAVAAAPAAPAPISPKPPAITIASAVPGNLPAPAAAPRASPAAAAPVVAVPAPPVPVAPAAPVAATAEASSPSLVADEATPADAIPTYRPRPPAPAAPAVVASLAPSAAPAVVASLAPAAAAPPPTAAKPVPPSEAITSCAVALAAFGVKATPASAPNEGGCRVSSPVTLASAGDIVLMPKALVDCATAATLAAWLQQIVQPKAEAILGARVSAVRILDAYDCRTVDNIPGGNLSEHARGKAIDIGGFEVGGHWITVGAKLDDADQKFFDAVRASACGPFTTVLGPGADQYHTDNLHLDTSERQTAGPSKGLYCQ